MPTDALQAFTGLKHLRLTASFGMPGIGEYRKPSGQPKQENSSESNARPFVVLPPNIELLHLTRGEDRTPRLFDALKYLLGEREAVLSLSAIKIELTTSAITKNLESISGVMRLGRKSGIEVIVVCKDEYVRCGGLEEDVKWGMKEDIVCGQWTSGSDVRPRYENYDLEDVERLQKDSNELAGVAGSGV
jgi:hypothetical protein